MAKSAEEILADLDKKLIRPKKGVLDAVRPEGSFKLADGTLDGWDPNSKNKKSKSSDDAWWIDTLDVLSAPGNVITSQLGDWTDNEINRYDIPLLRSLENAVRGQMEAWQQPGFDLTKVPGIGALKGIGKYGTGSDRILENFGWERPESGAGKWGHMGASFVGDVALDPLSWVTFGGSAVLKASRQAGKEVAKDLAKKTGVPVPKEPLELPSQIKKATLEKYADKPFNPDLIQRFATKKSDNALKQIEDAMKTARADAQNALVNVNVPFADITKPFGKKPKFLQFKEGEAGVVGANAVRRGLEDLGLINTEQQSKLLDHMFGVKNPEQLTVQQLRNLQDQLEKVRPSVKLPGAEAVDPLAHIMRQTEKFVPDMGGTTALGRKFDVLNPRTLGSSNDLINSAGEMITATDTKQYNQLLNMQRELRSLDKAMKNFTPKEREAIPYIIEKHFPGNVTEAEYLKDMSPQVKEVAKQINEVLEKIGKEGMESGVLDNLRPNYFPHVIKYGDEQRQTLLAKFADDPEFAKLVGKSSTSQFAKERKSFQTLAQADNYIADLGEKLAKTTDNAERAMLQEKIDVVQNLFERDPLQALAKRYSDSIKKNAMKDLYDGFRKDGLLIKNFTRPDGYDQYTKLDAQQAKLLGLEQGEYLHKEVLKGLEKVDGLFKSEKIDRIVNDALAVQNMWKSLVTTYVPSHYWYNFVGNIANNALAGVRMRDYEKSVQILKDMKAGTLSEMDQKIIKEAIDNGVLHQGFIADFAGDRLITNRSSSLAKLESKFLDNKISETMRTNLGESSDNFARLALFIYAKNSTGSAKIASDTVRKYLFNYRELTDADRAIKAIVPFWNWTKNNIPLQLENFIKQPRYAQTYARMQEMLRDGQDPNELPTWVRQDGYLRVPGTDTYYNPRLPLTDLNMLGDPLDSLVNLIGPAKIPFELQANRSMFTGNPIDWNKKSKDDKYDPQALINYFLNQSGILGKSKLFTGDDNILESLRNLFFGKPFKLDK